MSKLHSRQELLIATRTRYEQLWAQINALPADGKTMPFAFKGRDRNVRDVLVHLAAWQEMYLRWSTTNMQGERRVRFLPRPYTWETCGALSKKIKQANQSLSFEAAKKRLAASHAAMIKQFVDLEQEQLFVPGFFKWTGTSTLGDYATLFSATRYAWANKVIAKFRQQLAEAKPQPVSQS